MVSLRLLPVKMVEVEAHQRGGVWVEEHMALRHYNPLAGLDEKVNRLNAIIGKYREDDQPIRDILTQLMGEGEGWRVGAITTRPEDDALAHLLVIAPKLPEDERKLIEEVVRDCAIINANHAIEEALAAEGKADPTRLRALRDAMERLDTVRGALNHLVPASLWFNPRDMNDETMLEYLAQFLPVALLPRACYVLTEVIRDEEDGWRVAAAAIPYHLHYIVRSLIGSVDFVPTASQQKIVKDTIKRYADMMTEVGSKVLRIGGVDEEKQTELRILMKALKDLPSMLQFTERQTASSILHTVGSRLTFAIDVAAREVLQETLGSAYTDDDASEMLDKIGEAILSEDEFRRAIYDTCDEQIISVLTGDYYREACSVIEEATDRMVRECLWGGRWLEVAIGYKMHGEVFSEHSELYRNYLEPLFDRLWEIVDEFRRQSGELDPEEVASTHPMLRSMFGEFVGKDEAEEVEFETEIVPDPEEIRQCIDEIATHVVKALHRLMIKGEGVERLPEQLRGYLTEEEQQQNLVRALSHQMMKRIEEALEGSEKAISRHTLIGDALHCLLYGKEPPHRRDEYRHLIRTMSRYQRLRKLRGDDDPTVMQLKERIESITFRTRWEEYIRERSRYAQSAARLTELIAACSGMSPKDFSFVEFVTRYAIYAELEEAKTEEERKAKEKEVKRKAAHFRERVLLRSKDKALIKLGCGAEHFERLGLYHPDEESCFAPGRIHRGDVVILATHDSRPDEKETFVSALYLQRGEEREWKCAGRAIGIFVRPKRATGNEAGTLYLTNFYVGDNPRLRRALKDGVAQWFAQRLGATVMDEAAAGGNVPMAAYKNGDGVMITFARQQSQK